MAIMLTSILPTHYKDEEENYHPIALDDTNSLLSNIKKYLPKQDRLVLVANDPYNEEKCDEKIPILRDSFALSGIPFKEYLVLDHRNMDHAKEILSAADLIILSGGKCGCQKAFFDKINLGKILRKHKGLTIGTSAGTMNLCETIANFPEEPADLDEPRWLEGLGLHDEIIIPHYDGENNEYQLGYCEIDIVNEYILPMSRGRRLLAMPNFSYVLIDGDKPSYYGDMYEIVDGITTKIN